MSFKKSGKTRHCLCCDKRRGRTLFAEGNGMTCKECKAKCTGDFCNIVKQSKKVNLALLTARVAA